MIGVLLLLISLVCAIPIDAGVSTFKGSKYFVTSSDTEHYPWLLRLLDSIVTFHGSSEHFTLIYDLGLKQEEITYLETHYQAKVESIELVHGDLLKKFVIRPNGRLARGWYAWKPVAIKQALERLPYFMYVDSGIRLAGPVDDMFNLIARDGYFLMECGHEIAPVITKRVIKGFELHKPENQWILKQRAISAGCQGVSKKVLNDYVMPIYRLAHDLQWFEDDGTSALGFGNARHDQVLFSVRAHQLGYLVHRAYADGPEGIFLYKGEKSFHLDKYFQFRHKQLDSLIVNPDAVKNCLIG